MEGEMTRSGIDYAWHHAIDTDALRSAGVTFAGRYVSHDGTKNLSRAEAHTLGAAGIDVFVVWESTSHRALEGHAAGAADAAAASAQATQCGMPPDRPIFFGVDFDAQSNQLASIADYLAGAKATLGAGRVGVYGSFRVVGYCLDHGAATWAWQTYAWSAGQLDHRTHVHQHRNGVNVGGIDCDLDTAYKHDFGQWRIAASEPPFPFPPGDVIGTAGPDPHRHSGATAAERTAIATWQAQMQHRGWALPPTGVYTRQSERICRAFQTEKGLVVDGLVGPVTWGAAWEAPITAPAVHEAAPVHA
jgi:peptidoglycan hydrolase-like protein with peptidoglycan-binding domain